MVYVASVLFLFLHSHLIKVWVKNHSSSHMFAAHLLSPRMANLSPGVDNY